MFLSRPPKSNISFIKFSSHALTSGLFNIAFLKAICNFSAIVPSKSGKIPSSRLPNASAMVCKINDVTFESDFDIFKTYASSISSFCSFALSISSGVISSFDNNKFTLFKDSIIAFLFISSADFLYTLSCSCKLANVSGVNSAPLALN